MLPKDSHLAVIAKKLRLRRPPQRAHALLRQFLLLRHDAAHALLRLKILFSERGVRRRRSVKKGRKARRRVQGIAP